MVAIIGTISQITGLSPWLIWIFIFVALLYIYGTWNYSTFKKMDIPGPAPWPLLGSFPAIFKEGFKMDIELIKKFGKVFGYFEGVVPVIVIAEPEYIKQITVKDFDHFVDRRGFVSNKELKKGVLTVKGDEWKTIRSAMSPTFSGGKMKKMAGTIEDCGDRLVRNLNKFADTGDMFEVKHVIGCFTMDVVAETLFGIKVNSQDDYKNEFVQKAKKAFEEFSFGNAAVLVNFFAPFLTPLIEKLGMGSLSQESVDFFYNKVHSVLKMRSGMKEKPIDFLQLLLDAHADDHVYETEKMSALEETTDTKQWKSTRRALTEEEIVANSLLFFLVGYETTAATVGWMVYNLSLNEDCQDKLYEDVKSVYDKYKKLDYEAIAKMTYLDQVFCESLRLFPPAMRTDRVCNKDCDVGPYHIPSGMIINISILGVHMQEEYWPEPEKFDPDRFSAENRDNIVPYSYLPFGSGPRNCIGMRLANLEAKIAMAQIIKNFKIKRCEKTEVPIKLKNVGLTIPQNGIWIRMEKRK